MTIPPSVTIIGAGLAGLTAALALLRAGHHVRVFEQAAILSEVGAGISLSAGAGRGLAALGIGDALLAVSLPTPAVAFVHYRTGALLTGMFDMGQPEDRGFATVRHIHRADLHGVLLAAVRAIDPSAVVVGQRLTGVVQDECGVTAYFADTSHHRSELLVAADGTRSTLRKLMFEDSMPEFAGQIAFRCLIPYESAAPFLRDGNAVVSVGAGRIFHRYLLRNRSLVNVIGLIKRAPSDTLIKWGLFVRPPLTNWHNGRVVLIGDAAHPILPFLGLGAALAMEDGVVLARALAAAPTLDRALNGFYAARVDRVENVRTQTILQGETNQACNPDAADLTGSPSQNIQLFAYDPTTVVLDV